MFLYIPWNKGLSHPIQNYSVMELPHSVAFNIGVVLKPMLMLHHCGAVLLGFLITGCMTTCLILPSDWNQVKGCFYLLFFILPRWMELLVAPSCLSTYKSEALSCSHKRNHGYIGNMWALNFLELWLCSILFVSLVTSLALKFFFFNWRIIALQCCMGFCHTTTISCWISYKFTYSPHILSMFQARLSRAAGIC